MFHNWCWISSKVVSIEVFRSGCGGISCRGDDGYDDVPRAIHSQMVLSMASLSGAVGTLLTALRQQLLSMLLPRPVGGIHLTALSTIFPMVLVIEKMSPLLDNTDLKILPLQHLSLQSGGASQLRTV